MGYISKDDAKRIISKSIGRTVTRLINEIEAFPAADVVPREDYHTDHGYIWLCPECGLSVHSDDDGCPRCGHKRNETWRK